ncbi:helix-turn-helix domain-containing protein [Planktothrix agardhii]|jgi:HTH-type transcriptional regulator/antitoxin HigA|uniref:Transcription regulator with HTH domain n=3 Tax=Planktothrix agardhii TaxID=1160 RepID=A0A1J1JIJ1_PLAAG|nr:transcriptional regulator [Planktothrix agardhii]MCF3608157.1 transcriptional regulator [Planktothrix agardhii 1033]MBG0748810.1 transcriptional regulator [Planktothrix agardhii KL2]MCB8776541.1 transcriptional regulator [Planktothrix agardhii 1031]MCB8785289.1 transcriptional regulator [Planktothrix agardhii 1025]MCF3577010.1 transcriptional regulator [Planktothrix agardhii 1812]
MTLTIDKILYSNLLAEIRPQVIETEEEYDRILAIVERLTFSKTLTPEERVLLKLLVQLIETYESEMYPIDESTPDQILQHLIEVTGTCEGDLVGVIGASDVVSDVVNNKRSISKTQAQALADYFQVSINLFIYLGRSKSNMNTTIG